MTNSFTRFRSLFLRSPFPRDRLMADPLSIAASTAALLHCTRIIISFTRHCIKAEKERQKFVEELERLEVEVEELHQHIGGSNEEDPWYQRVTRMIKTSGELTKEGKYVPYPDPDNESAGPLTRLYKLIAKLHSKLRPDQPSHGIRKSVEHLTWYWGIKELTEILAEISESCTAVSRIIALDHFEASKAAAISSKTTESSLKTTAEYVRRQGDQVTDISLRIKTLEEYSNKKQQKEEEEDVERERQLIMRWLSPTLDFLARQKDLYDTCFESAGQWFLDHDVFQLWALGQSWHLRCNGRPGTGKVGV